MDDLGVVNLDMVKMMVVDVVVGVVSEDCSRGGGDG